MKNRFIVVALVICILVAVAVNIQYLKAILVQVDRQSNEVPSHPDHDRPIIDDTTTRHRDPPKRGDVDVSKNQSKDKAEPSTTRDKAKNYEQPKQPKEKVIQHKVAGLNCDKFGGPFEQEALEEMVYWRDIPKDALHESPFANYGSTDTPKYLTFEPDEGGWNNIRMSMETATALAQAMGRILVLPYEQNIYLLRQAKKRRNNRFTFHDFFHFESIANEHPAVEVISMKEFIEKEAMTGHIRNKYTGEIAFPPENRTVWEGHLRTGKPFYSWLRNVTEAPIWFFEDCVVGFAKEPGPEGAHRLKKYRKKFPNDKIPRADQYTDKPTPVDGKPFDRLMETLNTRRKVCVYDDHYQNAKVVHFMGDNDSGARLLTHFYTYMFFEDYHHDLWIKRFVRDHLRYIDEIQCAAARIVQAMRQKAIENGNSDGVFDSFHIRRGDFQYKKTRIEADEIYNNTFDVLEDKSTIYIATDERNKTFFDVFREKGYQIYFLDDFADLIPNVNKNYFGMLDQRIASRGRTFIGAYFSTFTGYINRMRGYHSQKDKLDGWELGRLNSYYYVPIERKYFHRSYRAIDAPMWGKEFPIGWRDIDHDLKPEDFADISR